MSGPAAVAPFKILGGVPEAAVRTYQASPVRAAARKDGGLVARPSQLTQLRVASR